MAWVTIGSHRFRMKYHPDEQEREDYKRLARLRQRLNIYMGLYSREVLTKAKLDASAAPDLMKIMDTIVIKLEGGTDFDLEVLEEIPDSEEKSDKEDEKPPEPKAKPPPPPEPKQEDESKSRESKEEGEADDDDEKSTEEQKPDVKENQENFEKQNGKDVEEEKKSRPPEPPEPPAVSKEDKKKARKKKRKEREYTSSSDSSSSSDSDSESESEPPVPPGVDGDKPVKPPAPPKDTKAKEEKDKEIVPKEPEEPKPRALHRTFSLFFRNIAPNLSKKELVDVCRRYPGYMRMALADPGPERGWTRHGWVTYDRGVNIKEICWNLSNIRLKDCELSPVVNRDLAHRIRAVSGITAHKSVIKADLKLAARLIQNLDDESKVWDPKVMPENPDKPPEPPEDAGAPPPEQPPTAAKKEEEKEKKDEKKPELPVDAPLPPPDEPPPPPPPEPKKEVPPPLEIIEMLPPPDYERNPVLENITEYLVDESSAEEQLLLGSDLEEREEGQEDSNEIAFDRDPAAGRVLDRLLCYLRFVHSVDYYSASKFHIEDDMPSRCGLMHVRGANPPSRLTQKDLDTWKTNFERKIGPLVNKKPQVSQDDLKKLGFKDQDAEVEKLITTNTVEMAKDKWLCPLSGKKFKGPEFVRKHIFNKHSEKIDTVKKEVDYFNNYLKDTSRPQPPDPTPAAPPAREGGREAPPSQGEQRGGYNQGPSPPRQEQGGGGFNQNRGAGGNFNQGGNFGNNYQPPPPSGPPIRSNFDPYGYTPPSYSRPGPRRPIIQYRDLDAPDSNDFF